MVNELLIILVVYIQAIEEDLDLMCTLLKQWLSAIKHNISNKIIYKDKHKMLFTLCEVKLRKLNACNEPPSLDSHTFKFNVQNT